MSSYKHIQQTYKKRMKTGGFPMKREEQRLNKLATMIQNTPNDMTLGKLVRAEFRNEHEQDGRATVNNSKSTSVTSHLLGSSFTEEENEEFSKEVQTEFEFPEIDINLAYISAFKNITRY